MAVKKPTASQVKKLTARLDEIDKQVTTLTAEKAQIKETLALLPPGQYDAGDYALVVSTTNTIDTAITSAKFPADEYPDFYKLTFDVKEFRKHIAPVDIHKYEKTTPRITVKEK